MGKVISEKLLSKILDTNVTRVYFLRSQGWRYSTDYKQGGWSSTTDVPLPNDDKLTRLCKEWLLKQDNVLQLDMYLSTNNTCLEVISIDGFLLHRVNGMSEVSVVIKACELLTLHVITPCCEL